MRPSTGLVTVIGTAVLAAAACKGSPTKIEALRDGLAAEDPAPLRDVLQNLPACNEPKPEAVAFGKPGPLDKGCLSEIANALGSKRGFFPAPPDQAADATVAVVLARDGRGDFVAHADVWLTAVKTGKGPGPDALRLAIARKMVEVAPMVGRKIEEDKEANEALKAVASAIPGACPTYRLLGTGVAPAAMNAELSPDHSACVQKDLSRREGPGGGYGSGTFRALEGSLALWREAERALRLGLPMTALNLKSTLEGKLAVIEPTTQRIATKKSADTQTAAVLGFMGDVHAEAGVLLWKPKDAGADAEAGAAEAGAPASSGASTSGVTTSSGAATSAAGPKPSK